MSPMKVLAACTLGVACLAFSADVVQAQEKKSFRSVIHNSDGSTIYRNDGIPVEAWNTRVMTPYGPAMMRQQRYNPAAAAPVVAPMGATVVTPPPQVWAARKATSSSEVLQVETPGGHIGSFMGGREIAEYWPAILDWLIEHDAAEAGESN